jgi:L-aspartate oxidase
MDLGLYPAPLATEALRGEGATLINAAGDRFMQRLHPDAELAPRDIVARGVFAEIAAKRGAYLDCRDAVGARFAAEYPTVYAAATAAGIDPAREPIPVAPAAHYHMGGVATDANGRTSVPGLWAAGEVASTGLHGANRLASNSLLEAAVFGARVATDIKAMLPSRPRDAHVSETRRVGTGGRIADPARRTAALAQLRQAMSDHVGVIRDARGLRSALATFTEIEREAAGGTVLANMALAARLVAGAALLRKESRGGHFRSDFPDANPAMAHRSLITVADLAKLDRRSTSKRAGDHATATSL